MSGVGKFIGIGVGPGPAGYIPLAAWQALQAADVILLPRAKASERSVAAECLRGLEIDATKVREVAYGMDSDRTVVRQTYAELAESIASELRAGRTVAYLTIGDSLTYSTYSYTLEALLQLLPELPHCTYPGITSYAAIASALDWPLGQGKERTLILPCPDSPEVLRAEIETHDIVVLMKIGNRLPFVLDTVKSLGISQLCAFASNIGLSGEVLCKNVDDLPADPSLGYLSTMLIRKASGGGRR
jgi:precorrin-2/cobalt-factor-2 C20-methyltransferase